MADLTTEEIAELRLLSNEAHPMAAFAIWRYVARIDQLIEETKNR